MSSHRSVNFFAFTAGVGFYPPTGNLKKKKKPSHYLVLFFSRGIACSLFASTFTQEKKKKIEVFVTGPVEFIRKIGSRWRCTTWHLESSHFKFGNELGFFCKIWAYFNL